jgi:ribosome-binding protein aMBF1 (putative translation factor)
MSSIDGKIFTDYASALSYALELKRFTQRNLAEMVGKHESQVSRWINDSVTPYRKTQKDIESALHLRIIQDSEGWKVIEGNDAQTAINSVDQIREEVIPYKDKELTLDDLPELVRLRKMLEEKIDKLIK